MIGSNRLGLGSARLGGFSVRTAAGDAGGGDTPPITDISTLVWQSSIGTFLGTDNLDAHACVAVGALHGVTLLGDGELARLRFTAAGGVPGIGATVYMASSQDDAGTGRGKATATAPSTSMPVFPLWTQNLVVVGVCVDNADYFLDGTAVVRLAMPSAPNYVTPANQTFNFRRVTGTSSTNFFSHDGTLTESAWVSGQTILTCFTLDAIPLDTVQFPIANFKPDGTGGENYWGFEAGNTIVIYNGGGTGLNTGLQPVPGLNYLLMTVTGGNIRASLNGSAVVSGPVGPGGVPPAGSEIRMGTGFGWRRGGLTGAAKFLRAFSDGELQTFSRPPGDVAANPFRPPAVLRTDPDCQWWLDLTSWNGGNAPVNAGPAGAAWTFTVNGAPTSTLWTLSQNNNPAGLYLDGPTPKYSSKHTATDGEGQRIVFTAADVFELSQLFLGVSMQDTDNADEGAITIIINGTPIAAVLAEAVDGNIWGELWTNWFGNQFAVIAAITPPFTVEIIAGDKLMRSLDTFVSGTFLASVTTVQGTTFTGPTTTRRLVAVGDGQTLAGHSRGTLTGGAPLSAAAMTRVRAIYPGRVTMWGCSPECSVTQILLWGGGTVDAYARRLVDMSLEGGPSTIEYLVCLGAMDWYRASITPAAFGVGLGQLLDAIHALQPTSTIWCSPPVQDSAALGPNSAGDLLADFQAEVTALAGSRPWLQLVDLSGPNAIDCTPGDLLPSNPAGQVALTDNIQAALGF